MTGTRCFLLAATDPEASKAMNTELVADFGATGGRLGGAFDGVPLLLLTTTGARTRAQGHHPDEPHPHRRGYVVVHSGRLRGDPGLHGMPGIVARRR